MHISKPQDRIALDRASSRSVDSAGHLRVVGSIVSQACVSEYLGNEIPEFEALGLDPEKRYCLYRDPAALEAATDTLNGKPLLIVHRPQTADDHEPGIVCGSVYGAVWDAPNLRADLEIWDQTAIDLIESGEQRALSCGYAYRAEMKPGTSPDNEHFDGSMLDIVFNHTALVSDGRVPVAIVGDAALPKPFTSTLEKRKMPKVATTLSRQAILASGAIHAYLLPKLAADAKLDINAAVRGVSAKNWRTSKPKIAASLKAAAVGKLAQDADLEDVIEMLDQLDEVVDDMPNVEAVTNPEVPAVDDEAETEEEKADRMKKRAEMKAAAAAKDSEKKDEKVPDAVNKTAMDAAIAAAVANNEKALLARMAGVREAVSAVRPVIGEVSAAMDSAPEIYKLALDHLQVDYADMPDIALPKMLKLATDKASAPVASRVAMDAAAATSFTSRFPNANRLTK